MVCRVHKYADGGKVVKDHLAPAQPTVQAKRKASPGITGAIKDFASAVGGAISPKSVTQRKSKLDKAIDESSS